MNAPPQLHVLVVDGLQYAALAKCVNGANESICEELSVVMAWRLTVTAVARTSTTEAREKRGGNQNMGFGMQTVSARSRWNGYQSLCTKKKAGSVSLQTAKEILFSRKEKQSN